MILRAATRQLARRAPPFVYGFRSAIGQVVPRRAKPALHAWHEYLRRWCDPELRLVPLLCDPLRVSIDVGAMLGYYAWWMQLRSAHVVALEPHPELAAKLARGSGRKMAVLPHAASDRSGMAELWRSFRGTREIFGCTSLEPGVNTEYERVAVSVPTCRIDDLGLLPVGLVKINAEGHEAAILSGATRMIATQRPVLLIAIEERFRCGAVAEIQDRLESLGYAGWFIWNGALLPAATFDPELHQQPWRMPRPGEVNHGDYVNWFLFIPARRPDLPLRIARWLRWCRRLGLA
jgi:FkbM family methyltransferase